MSTESNARRTIPKALRFDVFKRDSFKCQYCGSAAPEFVLHIDHILPRAKGGTNDITNLITSCLACNLGKSDKVLDENTALAKSRSQLEELQERREQLEMMMQWREGLRDLTLVAVDKLSDYWSDLAPGFSPNENGRKTIKRWLRQYSLDEILRAMDISSEQYLETDGEGQVTGASWELAFSKIPGICRVDRESVENPDLKELFYVRGIVRNKCEHNYDASDCMEWLKAARSWDVPMQELRSIALQIRHYGHFSELVSNAINQRKSKSA
jgi:hypothetical protein